jgi:hypothetical protein
MFQVLLIFILDSRGHTLSLAVGQILLGTGSFDSLLVRRHFAFLSKKYLYSLPGTVLKGDL